MTLYADDTVLIQLSQSDRSQLVLGMKQTNDWLDRNTLNFDKTFSFSFQKRVETKAIKHQLRKITLQTKNLGILIDEKLNYNDHIQYLIHKKNVFCATFYKLRTALHKNQLVFAYKTCVLPILKHGVLIYGTKAKSDIKKLNNKIKRLVKIIFGKCKF